METHYQFAHFLDLQCIRAYTYFQTGSKSFSHFWGRSYTVDSINDMRSQCCWVPFELLLLLQEGFRSFRGRLHPCNTFRVDGFDDLFCTIRRTHCSSITWTATFCNGLCIRITNVHMATTRCQQICRWPIGAIVSWWPLKKVQVRSLELTITCIQIVFLRVRGLTSAIGRVAAGIVELIRVHHP